MQIMPLYQKTKKLNGLVTHNRQAQEELLEVLTGSTGTTSVLGINSAPSQSSKIEAIVLLDESITTKWIDASNVVVKKRTKAERTCDGQSKSARSIAGSGLWPFVIPIATTNQQSELEALVRSL
jgi:hypothetical protein